MHHVVVYFDLSSSGGLFNNHAYLAVDCFYMISGFVIAHSFDRKMDQGLTLSRFYMLRVLRLYPMLIAGSVLGAFGLGSFWFLHREISLSSILTAGLSGVFLVPTYALLRYKPYVFPLNISYWSLSFEFLLYAFYAISYRTLKYPLILAGALLFSAVALVWVSATAGGLDVGFRADDYFLGFGRALLPFLVGMAIRRSRLYRPNSLRFGSFAVVLTIPLFCNPCTKSGVHDVAVVLVILPLMVICLANARRFRHFDKVENVMGDLSYPMYAIHYPVVVACANACKLLRVSAEVTVAAAFSCIVGIVMAAMLLSRYYDRPVRAAMTKWFDAIQARKVPYGRDMGDPTRLIAGDPLSEL